jgi:hypothetical protein
METKKMIDRLSIRTSKPRDKLLINQINKYRLRKEKIDETDINNIMNNNLNPKSKEFKKFEVNLQWLSTLRDYKNDIKKDNTNRRCFSRNNRDFLSNMKSTYSFDKRDIIYNLCRHTSPVYAQITPIIYKENEKIRDTLNDSKYQNKNNKHFNLSFEPLFINNKKKDDSFKGLNIRGKKLINFEIELSKDLEGKKKKLIHYPYKDDETTNKLYAKSYSLNNFFVPKSVKNTIDLHYDKDK